ncbi:LysR family transcriptional regulator [Rothia koreensis]|uniref:LysR family transcriptional regulator n=1 Tax=Rothia koreensis TaxID=592378 RepID=UPI003F2521BD
MDIESLRTFVALAETGRFQAVADDLRITQQAVSKRIVSLEKHLGVSLLTRTTRGSRLTLDGQALLPHAERVMRAVDQAEKAVRPGSRPLRVDILNRRISPAQAVYRFHQAYPEAALDAVTLGDENSAQAAQAVLDGSLDASFRALAADDVPEGVRADRILEVPLQLLVGPNHPLAGEEYVRPSDLADHRIWIPGIRPGTEWERYYRSLAESFGVTIDALGPHFGDEALMDSLADSASLGTLVGNDDRYLWPDAYGLRRIPLRRPTPLYPHLLITRSGETHPVLTALREYLRNSAPQTPDDAWTPEWVTH